MLFVVVLSLLCTAWSQNVYTVIVKSSDTEEFDVVELYNTNGADSAWHSPSFMTLLGVTLHLDSLGRGKHHFGILGCHMLS